MYFLCALFILPSLVGSGVLGYTSGAPNGACFTLTPGHQGFKQSTPSPYQIKVQATSIDGSSITVGISGNASEHFQGFILQARDGGGEIIGSFLLVDSDTNVQTMDCAGTANSVTHTSNSDKPSVSVFWTPPRTRPSDFHVTFRATVAKNMLTWWEDITSVTLKSSDSKSPGFGPSVWLIVGVFVMVLGY